MSKLQAFNTFLLKFKTPVHIGQLGITLEDTDDLIRADTLFSAIISALYQLYPRAEIDNLLKKIIEDPSSLRLSSAFPFIKRDGEITYYFPKPILPFRRIVKRDDLSRKYQKKIKKTVFIPKVFFEKILEGKLLDLNDVKEIEKDELKNFIKKQRIPRVVVNRINAKTNVFYLDALVFHNETHLYSGLFFMVDCKNSEILEYIKSGLRFLQDHGIGGERTYGFGLFEYQMDEITFKVTSENYIVLSPFIPNSNELNKIPMGYYDLIRRGGWVVKTGQRSYPLKPINIIVEGSVFPFRPEGRIVDIAPDDFKAKYHSVYRFGRPFILPIKGGFNA